MCTAEDTSLRFFAMMHVKDQVFGNFFRGTFLDYFRKKLSSHPYYQNNLQSTSCHISYFLPSCCLKLMYLTINLTFLGLIVKVKLSAKFSLHSFQ